MYMTPINSSNDIRKTFYLEKVSRFLFFLLIWPGYHGASHKAYNMRQTPHNSEQTAYCYAEPVSNITE